MTTPIYPWQQEIWDGLLRERARLPHALLLHGPEGSGKRLFAESLAGRLLCEEATGTELACGHCQACNWLASGNHPDYRLVLPEAETEAPDAAEGEKSGGEAAGETRKRSTQIRIDQIRALADFMVVGTHRQGLRVVLLRPAEAMNVPTANSLLKLLEEPVPGSLFILVSHNLNQLLPTLKSRCRLLRFGKPDAGVAADWLAGQGQKDGGRWLALAGGMPLLALKLATGGPAARHGRLLAALSDPAAHDPLRLAAELDGWLKAGKSGEADVDMPTLVDWLQKWVFDLARTATGLAPLYHPDSAGTLAGLSQKTSLAAVFACYNDLQRAQGVARHPLNARLFLEDMLLRYGRLFAGAGGRGRA